MTDPQQLGFSGMGLEPTPDTHVRDVLLGRSGPWKPTELQRQLLHILLYHLGAQQAIPLHALMVKLDRVLKPAPSEREIKDAMRSLVVDFRVRIGASRSKPNGYFLITTTEEARDAAHLYISEIIHLAQRVRVLLDPHHLGDLAGQRWIESLLTEQLPVPTKEGM
jgi:hypothetical protein